MEESTPSTIHRQMYYWYSRREKLVSKKRVIFFLGNISTESVLPDYRIEPVSVVAIS